MPKKKEMPNALYENGHKGAFHADIYAVGTPKDPASYNLHDMYKEIDPADGNALRKFSEDLTYLHEGIHLSQFVSTNFGLDFSYSLHAVFHEFLENAPWTKDKFNSLYFQNKSNLRWAWLDHNFFRHQISRQIPIEYEHASENEALGVLYFADNVALYPQNLPAYEKLNLAHDAGGLIHPRIYAHGIPSVKNIYYECNAATLFEGYAFAAEMRYTFTSLPSLFETAESISNYIAKKLSYVPPVYSMAFDFYMIRNKLTPEFFVAHLSALIDIALMYSPFILHGINPTSANKDDRQSHFWTPFDTFVRACDAAENIAPIANGERSELQRYQDDICAAMGIPGTIEMTGKSLEMLESIGIGWDELKSLPIEDYDQTGTSGNIIAHYIGLRGRVLFGDAYFYELQDPYVLSMQIQNAEANTTYFNTETRDLWRSRGSLQYSSTTIGKFLEDFMSSFAVGECPFRSGEPFTCHAKGHDGHCARYTREGSTESACQFYNLKSLIS